jgi:hypothetical protein
LPVAETKPVTERARVREIDDDEGRPLVRIIRRGSGPVVTWRRAQMVLLSAQGTDAPAIVEYDRRSQDRLIHRVHHVLPFTRGHEAEHHTPT